MKKLSEEHKAEGWPVYTDPGIIHIGGSSDKIIWDGPRTIPIDYGLVNKAGKTKVYCALKHRNVVLETTIETVKEKKHSISKHPTSISGLVYNLHIDHWKHHWGDVEWKEKLFKDKNWKK